MFAIIETGGKQLIVKENDVIFIEKIEGNENDTISFNNVLMVDKKVGTPYISGAKVTGVIEKQGKQKKIVIYRHNSKSNFKRKLGHRQPFTRVKVTGIQG